MKINRIGRAAAALFFLFTAAFAPHVVSSQESDQQVVHNYVEVTLGKIIRPAAGLLPFRIPRRCPAA